MAHPAGGQHSNQNAPCRQICSTAPASLIEVPTLLSQHTYNGACAQTVDCNTCSAPSCERREALASKTPPLTTSGRLKLLRASHNNHYITLSTTEQKYCMIWDDQPLQGPINARYTDQLLFLLSFLVIGLRMLLSSALFSGHLQKIEG